MPRFADQTHRIGYVKTPYQSRKPSPCKVVTVAPERLADSTIATLPLSALGNVTTQLSKVTQPDVSHPWRTHLDTKLSKQTTETLIATLRDCASDRKRLGRLERKILLQLYEGEAHLLFEMRSFTAFLKAHFDKPTQARYQKEIAVGRKEQLLSIPLGTYMIDEFEPLERFRCYVPLGSGKRNEKGLFIEKSRAGVKRDETAIERLKECWQIASELAASDRLTVQYLREAVKQMVERYPEYRRSERVTFSEWKNRALAAEAEVVRLRERLSAYETI